MTPPDETESPLTAPTVTALVSQHENYDRLRALLHELFQFDRADLDFGIYRIMNQRRAEIGKFLDEDLLPQIREALGTLEDHEQQRLLRELQLSFDAEIALGMARGSSPKTKEIQATLAGRVSTTEVEAEVFSDLFTFFNRYYDEGDFISLRRYKAGVYAIPYEGEETKFYWANDDQYYVKTMEDFRDYRFVLEDARAVHFRLAAAETGRENNRAASGGGRRFVLREEQPVAEVDGELELSFEFRQDSAKQATLNAQAIERILADPAIRPWRDALFSRSPSASNPERTVLAKHLADYTAKNTFDYFIHKDLARFLRRELDFFLKNEILHIDALDTEDERRANHYLARLRAIKRVGHKIIDFLAQLEDFQKRLFLKQKFVLATNYCITVDQVPEPLHADILENDAQWEEWEQLFAISELPEAGDRQKLLRAQPHLILDTRWFGSTFKQVLLEALPNLDEITNGLLIQADNFHALRLLREKERHRVHSIYIDPPYNTNASEILYKNNYKDSSWLSLMDSRLQLAKELLADTGRICVTIDDVEFHNLRKLLDQTLGADNHLGTVVIRNNPQGRSTVKGFRITHEYALFYRAGAEAASVGRLERTEAQGARWDEIDEEGRAFLWENFRKTGTDSQRDDRPKQFYPLYFDGDGLRVPTMAWSAEQNEWTIGEEPDEMEIILWPIDSNGTERVWKWGRERVIENPAHLKVEGRDSSSLQIYNRNYPQSDGRLPSTWWDDARYAAGSHGTNVLTSMFGSARIFDFPKSVHAVADCLKVVGLEPGGAVLDFFAGSGTTAHAVIDLNRRDGGQRRFTLVEIGDYFNRVLVPRVKKTAYSSSWREGKPVSREGLSFLFKCIELESYEDSLANIELMPTGSAQRSLLDANPTTREDYLLRYMLDAESSESASLLDLERFSDPFNYQLRCVRDGETRLVAVDLPETFNMLLGLTVQRVRFDNGFQAVEGIDPDGARVLVIWRSLSDERHTNELLEAFCTEQGYLDRAADDAFDRIYVNGDCTLSRLRPDGSAWQVSLTEEAFQRLMFDPAEVGRA